MTTPEPAPRTDQSAAADHLDENADTGDLVDEWGRQSFPASDPPANW